MAVSIFVAVNNNNNKESLFVTNENAARNNQKPGKTKGGNTVFAGNFNMQENTIEIKRKLAQKRAMKIVSDTFATDSKLDNEVDGLRAQQEQYRKDALEDKKILKEIDGQRIQLASDYNVSENSQEHKDLELLRKEQDALDTSKGIVLTDSEKEQLAELHKNGLTNYQKDMLELDSRENLYKERAGQKDAAAKMISGTITDIGIERLKTHEMVDASKESDAIMEQANKELIGSLFNEGKEHIDEEMKEKLEKAGEKAEAKEEEEEKKAVQKKKKLELEKQIEETKQNAEQTAVNTPADVPAPSPAVTKSSTPENIHSDVSSVQDVITKSPDRLSSEKEIDRELEKIINELKLIKEDLKGAQVDASI